jgi:hypothetical protein
MERATLANRCIIIEADKRFKETDIKQIFSNVVQLTALKKETTTELPQVRTTSYGLQSFRYAGTKRWNELPDEFRKQPSLNQFKTLISSWSGSSCRCFACKTS